jgi:putative SOS response-associated peptidase YedK
MCNRYNIRGTTKEIGEFLQAAIPFEFNLPSEDILPGYIAPGLLRNLDGERELVPMQFGLAKIGASEPFDRERTGRCGLVDILVAIYAGLGVKGRRW